MKFNKILIALALCAGMQSNVSFGSEMPVSQSYYQQYAPQRMQDMTSYISQKATNAYNTVNSWSTQKKIAVLTGILLSLGVSAYVINRIISNDIPTQEPELTGGSNISVREELSGSRVEKSKPINGGGAFSLNKEQQKREANLKAYLAGYLKDYTEYLKNYSEYEQLKGQQLPGTAERIRELDRVLDSSRDFNNARLHMMEEGMSRDEMKDIDTKLQEEVLGKVNRMIY